MFGRLGEFAFSHRRAIPACSLGLMLLLLGLSVPFGGQFPAGGFSVPGSQSQRGSQLLSHNFGAATTSLLLVYQSAQPNAATASVQAMVDASFARLAQRPQVASVLDYTNTKQSIFIGGRGHDTFVVVNLKLSQTAATNLLPSLESSISPPRGLRMWVTGTPAIDALYNSALEQQLKRAELIALPVSLLLLVIVFGSVVAALLPLVITGLAVPTALALISLIAARLDMSIFVTNVATIIGLGLSIDYSLFFVKRFREESSHSDVRTAVKAATASAGKAVATSGVAVAAGLSSLTLFPATALRSMGVGGVVVVACTLLFALTALPALLALLGTKVNLLSLRGSLHRAGQPANHRSNFWGWVARVVMRHPVAIALPTAIILLVAGTPFLSLRLSTGASVAAIPDGPARTGYALLNSAFPQAGGVDALSLVLDYGHPTGGLLSAHQQRQLAGYLGRVRALSGVQGINDVLTPPPGLTSAVYLKQLQLPPPERPARLNSYIASSLAGPVAQFAIANSFGPDSRAGAALVGRLRALSGPPGAETLVTGRTAQSVDFVSAVTKTVPWALLLVVAVTMLVLFLTFGSVVLPVKAVLMSVISISAAFGAVVWIFQEGHLSNVLGFTAPGSIAAPDPVLMFAIMFGLSMDYEVFLLTRIRERHLVTGDNRQAVAEGLASTGGVITSAALIMITVFAAFAVGHVLDIQILGVGMAVAVAVDATLVRGIMVPALMRLLGELNWWAPQGLKRLVERLGFQEMPVGPGEFLTLDEIANRLALPPDMIRRRLGLGDIPVHWGKVGGKLEMRVATVDVGWVPLSAPEPGIPGPAADGLRPAAGQPAAKEWANPEDAQYPQALWTLMEELAAPGTDSWGTDRGDPLPPAQAGSAKWPLWRPDHATWNDEPPDAGSPISAPITRGPAPQLTARSAGEVAKRKGKDAPVPSSSVSAPDPEPPIFATPQALALGSEPSSAPRATYSASDPTPPAPMTEGGAPPSALVAAQTREVGAVAINSMDARKLVAELFERWERALEQRIGAEQRLRFEVELERRLRQVRDLRQELDQTRKTSTDHLSEGEQEMRELRNRVRELEQAPKGRRRPRR
ncbi:MAG: MMPL family transporter [Candidatus Dormibacteria bacterium]